MKAVDYLKEHEEKDGRVPYMIALDAIYMARDEALNSLRNQMAGQILQGFVSNPTYSKDTIMAKDVGLLIDHSIAIADEFVEHLFKPQGYED